MERAVVWPSIKSFITSTEKGVFVLMLKELDFFCIFQHKGCIKTCEVLGLIWTLCQQKLLAMNETPELPTRHGERTVLRWLHECCLWFNQSGEPIAGGVKLLSMTKSGHSEPAPKSAPWKWNGKWSGNNFLLGSSSLANNGFSPQLLFFSYLPTYNPQAGC